MAERTRLSSHGTTEGRKAHVDLSLCMKWEDTRTV
jgi:hypothetical protein